MPISGGIQNNVSVLKCGTIVRITFSLLLSRICSNPPYSILNKVLDKSCDVCNKGFCYVLMATALSIPRLNKLSKKGFNLTKISFVQVKKWFGFNLAVVLFEKNKASILCIEPKNYNLNQYYININNFYS